jgi:hypothetical protein
MQYASSRTTTRLGVIVLDVHAYKRDFPFKDREIRRVLADLLPAAVNCCYEESQLPSGAIKLHAADDYFEDNGDVRFPNGVQREEDLVLYVFARNLPEDPQRMDKCQELIRQALAEVFMGRRSYAVWFEVVRASWGSDLDPASNVTEMQLPRQLRRVVENINDKSPFWREPQRPLC